MTDLDLADRIEDLISMSDYVPTALEALALIAELREARRERDEERAKHSATLTECAIAHEAVIRERDALRVHYDAAGPEHNLLALLDLYHDRIMAAEAERDEALFNLHNADAYEKRLAAALAEARAARMVPIPDDVRYVLDRAADAIVYPTLREGKRIQVAFRTWLASLDEEARQTPEDPR